MLPQPIENLVMNLGWQLQDVGLLVVPEVIPGGPGGPGAGPIYLRPQQAWLSSSSAIPAGISVGSGDLLVVDETTGLPEPAVFVLTSPASTQPPGDTFVIDLFGGSSPALQSEPGVVVLRNETGSEDFEVDVLCVATIGGTWSILSVARLYGLLFCGTRKVHGMPHWSNLCSGAMAAHGLKANAKHQLQAWAKWADEFKDHVPGPLPNPAPSPESMLVAAEHSAAPLPTATLRANLAESSQMKTHAPTKTPQQGMTPRPGAENGQ
jgi:hypothetical protein